MKNYTLVVTIVFLFTLNSIFSQHQTIIPNNLYTNKAIKNGNWSDSNTWEGGKIPKTSAIVFIPGGITINYDVFKEDHLFAINNHGRINFKPSGNKTLKLVVDTFACSHSSFLNFDAPNNGKIEVVFKPFDIEAKKKGNISGINWNSNIKNHFSDGFAVKRLDNKNMFDGPGVLGRYKWDPKQLSLGLITMGSVRINGKDKTDFLPTTKSFNKNETKLTLTKSPVNWNVGDDIIVAGSDRPKETKVYKIKQVNGASITIENKLTSNYQGISSAGLYTYVGNMTRNIVFKSSYTDIDNNITRRGHVMFMHNPDVVVKNAQFLHLGRTDKTNLIDDFVFTVTNIGNDNARMIVKKDKDGSYIYEKEKPEKIENQRGRYSLHFHKTLSGGMGLVKATGNAVWGSPGWGMVHHDSNANFTDNVIFYCKGAGMISESGSELGIWEHNLSAGMGNWTRHSNYVGGSMPNQLRRDRRSLVDDDFVGGIAYGLQGRAVEMVKNIAADCGVAYEYQGSGEQTPVADKVIKSVYNNHFGFDAFPLEDKILRSAPPIIRFKDNVAFNCKDGFKSQNRLSSGNTRLMTVIENHTAWNTRRFGIYISSNFGYIFKGGIIHTDRGQSNLTAQAILAQTHDDNLSFSDISFYNFPIGVEIRNNIGKNTTNNNKESEFLFKNVKFHKSFTNSATQPSDPYSLFKTVKTPNKHKVFTRLPNKSFKFEEKGNKLDKNINVKAGDLKVILSGDVTDRAGTHAFGTFTPAYPEPLTFREYNFESDEKLVAFLTKAANDSDNKNNPVINNKGDGYAYIIEYIHDRLTAQLYKHYFKFNIKGTSYGADNSEEVDIAINGTYIIQNIDNKQNVIASSQNNHNAKMYSSEQIYPDHKWEFVHLGNKIHTVKNVGTQRFLEVGGGNCGRNANINTWTSSGGDHKKWYVTKIGDHHFLRPVHCENFSMDKSVGNNGNVKLWNYNTTNKNQQFVLIPSNNENASLISVKVFPSPAKDKLEIEFKKQNELVSYVITNLNGHRIKEDKFYTNKNTKAVIDLQGYKNGIYIIQFNTGRSKINFRKKFIIEK